MELSTIVAVDRVFIAGVTPYFLKRDNFWFEKNLEKISEARKTQTFFQDNTIFVEKNQPCHFSQFLRKLDEMGYEKILQVSKPGEFSQKGGIIDVFPINSNYAIRFEFFGNKIERIGKLSIQIENEVSTKKILKKKLKSQKLFSDLKGLKPGDYIVHLDHGIGIHNQQLIINNQLYYQLEYAQGDKLYVPVGLERKLSRYVGLVTPGVSRLGSLVWQRTKKKIKEDAIKFAKELLNIYAKRKIGKRPPYLPDDEIDFQLARSFQYLETPDQAKTIEDIKKDLEKDFPMDRLVCGDVGFGKTEVALRAAVKVAKSGRQTAIICPTTILANQHFQNFKMRLEKFPIKIQLLSRFQTKLEQKKIIEDLKSGKTDILIGTHRILSKDVAQHLFEKGEGLGLLIIDDEQRFGVKQKEKLKKIRTQLDILSLSATPIPRTLYLSISSIKTISLIQTPPIGRLPIKTFVLPWSRKIIQKAIEKEISRKGQIYYLHNQVKTIEKVKNFLENLFPKATVDIAHGRLKEKKLVKVMADFQNKKTDILVATTIIENGLDLPNVNTLIVVEATKLGLAQAYQIRGRIGRSHLQGFAYFLYPPKFSSEKFRRASGESFIEEVYPPQFRETKFGRAKARLQTLKEATKLGSGYKIALKDLEMRGAGNILGKEQSGSVNAIGLNLYCQMLSDAVEKLRITKPAP